MRIPPRENKVLVPPRRQKTAHTVRGLVVWNGVSWEWRRLDEDAERDQEEVKHAGNQSTS